MRRYISTAIALLITFSTAGAQFQDAGEVRAEVNLAAGLPQGEFDRHLDANVFGFGTFIGGRVPGLPLILGTELGYLNYGSDSRLRIHDTVFDGAIGEDLAVPVEAVRTGVSNNLLLGHLVVRLQPLQGPFQPYVDALAGIKYFATRVNVESDVIAFRHGLSQDSWITDPAFSYGVGGGFELPLHQQRAVLSDRTSTISLHAGVRYLFGTRAEYATENSLHELDGRLNVDAVKSRTDLIVPHIGLRVRH